MQRKLLTSFLLLAAAGLTACAGVTNNSEQAKVANEYAVEQNEEGVFVICKAPCAFWEDEQQQLEQEIMNEEDLAALDLEALDTTDNTPVFTSFFNFNESDLTPARIAELEVFFKELSSSSQPRKVLLKGYTDDIGPKEFNLKLAGKRVAKVAEVLAYLGFEIVEGQAHGKCCYVASNETPEGRLANRRVEIFFINNQEEVNDDANP